MPYRTAMSRCDASRRYSTEFERSHSKNGTRHPFSPASAFCAASEMGSFNAPIGGE